MKATEAKKLLPIIRAFAEGETIQVRDTTDQCGTWEDVIDLKINTDFEEYRIKPKNKGIKYRPFKDAKECWAEMLKHQPFGWLNYNGYRINTAAVMRTAVIFTNNKGHNFLFQQAFEECTFIDKQPFGVKVEK